MRTQEQYSQLCPRFRKDIAHRHGGEEQRPLLQLCYGPDPCWTRHLLHQQCKYQQEKRANDILGLLER